MNIQDFWTNSNHSIRKFWDDNLSTDYFIGFGGMNVDLKTQFKTKKGVLLVENFSFEKVEQSMQGMEKYTYDWINDTTLIADAARFDQSIEVLDSANFNNLSPIKIGSTVYAVTNIDDNTLTLRSPLIEAVTSGTTIQIVDNVNRIDLSLWRGQINLRLMTAMSDASNASYMDMQSMKGAISVHLNTEVLTIFDTSNVDTSLDIKWHQEEIQIQDIPTAYDDYKQTVIQIPCYSQLYVTTDQEIVTSTSYTFNVL